MFIWKILCVWKVFALGIYRYKKTVIPTGITVLRAIDGVRTRDPDLGKVVLYQLSHYRVLFAFLTWNNTYYTIRSYRSQHFFKNNVSEFLLIFQTIQKVCFGDITRCEINNASLLSKSML